MYRVPETIKLSECEEKLLEKGLNFVPKAVRTDAFQALNDADELKAYFANKDEVNGQVEEVGEFTPNPGQFEGVDEFVTNCRKDVKKVNLFKEHEQDNIRPEEMEALKRLQKRSDIVIKPADKGGAVCVWSKTLYTQEGLRQLQDTNFYDALPSDTTDDIQKQLQKEINRLIEGGELPSSAKNLLVRSPRCAVFYLLPKPHKAGTPGRPVISNIACPTYQISKFLSNILRPIVVKCPTYIKDTTHLLQKIDHFRFDRQSDENLLFTMDVKGLYTNIPNGDGLNALKFYLEREDENKIPVRIVLRLAELVLTMNCFQFNNKFYSQVSGTMMGTPFSVDYSCLTLSHQEFMINETYGDDKPVMYVRYIDDIFGVSQLGRDKLDKYIDFVRHFHPSLEYTVEVGNKVNMLDALLTVSGDRIESTLYTKPTDTHAYLNYKSCHPKSCKDNIPYSQFLRLRRICSNDKEFHRQAAVMSSHFCNQGYPRYVVYRACQKAKSQSRSNLLKESKSVKVKTRSSENADIVCPITYHPGNLGVVKAVKNNFERLQQDEDIGYVFSKQPIVAYRRGRNLKNFLVHSKLPRLKDNVGTKPCGRPRCLTCTHILANN
jgi:hypothetical protein